MSKRTQAQKQLTRRQMARRDREIRTQRIMTAAAIGVGVVIFLVLVYGIVTEVFIKARRPAAQVGDVTITAREFRGRQAYERWMTQLEIFQYQSYLSELSTQQLDLTTSTVTDTLEGPLDLDDGTSVLIEQLQAQVSSLQGRLSPDFAGTYGKQVLDVMIEEELLRQEAAIRGITVSEDEIMQRTELMLGYDRDAATDVLTDTETFTDTLPLPQQDFDDLYQQFKTNVLEVTRFSEEDFQAMMAAQLFRERLQTELAEDIEQVQDQVETIIYTLPTEEAAEALRSELNAEGADPQALVEELNADEDSLTSAYSMPWLPEGYLSSFLDVEIERVAFNTPTGTASPVVLVPDGQYFVVYVLGHEERELSADVLASLEQQAYSDWLAQQMELRVDYLAWEDAVVTD